MALYRSTDINAELAQKLGAQDAYATGEGGSEVDGEGVDRSLYESASLAILVEALLDNTETGVVSLVTIQDSADNSTFADVAAALQPTGLTLTLTGDASPSTQRGVFQHGVKCSGLRQYIRAQYTFTLSDATSDTARVAACWSLGGKSVVPAT